MDQIIEKICTKCGIKKGAEEFYKRASWCKSCMIVARKIWKKSAAGKESKRRQNKKYAEKHPDRMKEQRDRHYEKHKEEILLKCAIYRKSRGTSKWSKEWYAKYKISRPELYKKLSVKKRKYQKVQVETITEKYLKSLIRDRFKIKGLIPEDLLESYKQQIKIKRLLKQKKDENTKTS